MSVVSSPTSRRTVGGLLAASFRDFSAVWLLGFLVVMFGITATSTFLTTTTLMIVLTDQVTVGLLALALLVPLAAEKFDVSVAAVLSFAMVLTSTLAINGYGLAESSAIALVCCGILGAINGFLIVKLHINPFIATLGSSQVILAMTLLISQNQQLIPVLPDWFVSMTQGTYYGVNLDVFYLFGVAIILWYLLEHTPIGRSLFATGGNPEAARLAGVGTGGLIFGSFVVSALIAGFAGVLLLSKFGLYSQEYGPGYLFPAFAAVFFGATQLKGRPNVWGTLLAMYVLAVAVAGLQLTFFGNEYWITPLFNGAALLIAVALASRKQLGKAYRRLRQGKPTEGDLQAAQVGSDGSEPVPAARQPGS